MKTTQSQSAGIRRAFVVALAIQLTFSSFLRADTDQTFKVDPVATYGRWQEPDLSYDAPAISLASIGIHAGDMIQLTVLGHFSFVGGSETDAYTHAVFSSSNTLLDHHLQFRVPGAIAAIGGRHVGYPGEVPPHTLYGNYPAEIPEDFNFGLFDGDNAIVQVPEGAAYIYFAAISSLYNDNIDLNNDYFVQIHVLSTLSISMSRCNTSAYKNLDSSNIDEALVPSTDPNVLTSQPVISKGLVADGVTPLLFKIALNSASDEDKAATYDIKFDTPVGGGVTSDIASHLWILKNGAWVKSNSFTFGDTTTAYAYIAAISNGDLQLSGATEELVTMHVTKHSDSNVTNSRLFTLRKPPVVLVHGYNSNACAWLTPAGETPPAGDFTQALLATRSPDFIFPLFYPFTAGCSVALAVSDRLRDLAFDLDEILISQVEDHYQGLFNGWAFTRYDVVCHSQGGVLVRMLCQSYPSPVQGPSAPFARNRVISNANANRGRFRRVVTIDSPQNGSTLLRYISQLKLNTNSVRLLRLIPLALGQMVQSKFDPYEGEIRKAVNVQDTVVDNRLKCFRAVSTLIGQTKVPRAYGLLGLLSTPEGQSETRRQILIPEGSDGVVDLASQFAGAQASSSPPAIDISHSLSSVFSVGTDSSDTHSPIIAADVASLLNGSDGLPSSFSGFDIPGSVVNPSQSTVDSIAASLTVSDVEIILKQSKANGPTGSSSYTSEITPDPNDPVEGDITWDVENRTVNGIVEAGVTVTPDPSEPTQATVDVDDSVIGDVVLYVSYVSQKGVLVLGKPALVVSRPPASNQSGIDIGQSAFTVSIGDQVPVTVYADYTDGSRMPEFVGADEVITLSSANSAIVSADPVHDSFVAKAAGTTTVTVSFGGFTTQATVTVQPSIPPPTKLLNISTRLQVLNGDNVLIGGFTVTGSGSKQLLLRGIGPSLADVGISGSLPDPYLELHNETTLLASNDDWKATQETAIAATGLAPSKDKEAAILTTLAPGSYTVILKQKDGGTGIGLVEAYDLDQTSDSVLGNISTRGFVDVGDNVMIGGFISGSSLGGVGKILVRAIGPSLTAGGVAGALQDPVLELHDSNGDLLDTNDNWKDTQAAEISATGLAPMNDRESAILETLTAGAYTAIVRGVNNSTGVALVDAYQLDN